MDNIKLPIALILAMAAQLAAGVWWVSQQAATITDLEETVSQLGSKMAIEDNINLKRDVQQNESEIEHLWDETDDIWDENASLSHTISKVTSLQQRIAIIENELKYIGRDHDSMLDPRER